MMYGIFYRFVLLGLPLGGAVEMGRDVRRRGGWITAVLSAECRVQSQESRVQGADSTFLHR